MTPFKLNIGQKIFKYWKVTLKNLKFRKTSSHFSSFKFLGAICDKFWLKVKLIWNKNIFLKGFITKKREGGKNAPPCKLGLIFVFFAGLAQLQIIFRFGLIFSGSDRDWDWTSRPVYNSGVFEAVYLTFWSSIQDTAHILSQKNRSVWFKPLP